MITGYSRHDRTPDESTEKGIAAGSFEILHHQLWGAVNRRAAPMNDNYAVILKGRAERIKPDSWRGEPHPRLGSAFMPKGNIDAKSLFYPLPLPEYLGLNCRSLEIRQST